MKRAMFCFAFCLVVGLTGCHRDHDKIGDAPRTETASSVAGWKEISTSGIALRFPESWKPMDLTTSNFEKGADNVFGSDPKYAEMRSQASALAKQGAIKLIAFDTATIGSGFGTNCTVGIMDEPSQATLEQAADLTVSQMAPVVAAGTKPKLEYVTLNVGKTAFIRSEIASANPAIPKLVSLAYLHVKDSKLVVITFTTAEKEEARVKSVADDVMKTFRYGR